MLRLRNLLRTTQLSFQLSPPLSQHLEPLSVRRVKYRKPWLRRFVTSFLIYGAAFQIWSSFAFVKYDDPETDSSENPDDTNPRGSRTKNDESEVNPNQLYQDHINDEDRVFIPLSWPFLRPGEFYSGSDPEWEEFKKFSKDPQKIKELKRELADIVVKNASRSTRLSSILGCRLQSRRWWLMPSFPYRAPPQYRRLGLEISDHAMTLGLKDMDNEEGNTVRRFMQPLFVTLAIRDAFVVLMRRQLSRLRNKTADNAAKPDNPFHPHELPVDLGTLESLNYLPEHDPQSQLSTNSQSQTQADTPKNEDNNNPESSRFHHSSIIPTLHRLLLPGLGPGSDLHLALMAFKWRLRDCLARDSPVPQRGSFFMYGVVGINGPKGFCRVDVKGEYNPATRNWSNVSMQLKDLHPYKQRPLGRPLVPK